MYIKLQEPNTLTGLEVETCSVSLGELMMCVRNAVAKLRLRSNLRLTNSLGISGGGQTHRRLCESTEQMSLDSSGLSCENCQEFGSLR